jgi:hypothetical protein
VRLPPTRKFQRSGILRAPQRHWPRHERWVRSHSCVVPGCQNVPIEFAHVRTAENSGTGLKPHSKCGVSLCSMHHQQQHEVGVETFQALYKIDLMALADEFFRRSPDKAMRESLKAFEEILK